MELPSGALKAADGDLCDRVIPATESHLRRLVNEYVHYYHEDRTHLGLAKQTPGLKLAHTDLGA